MGPEFNPDAGHSIHQEIHRKRSVAGGFQHLTRSQVDGEADLVKAVQMFRRELLRNAIGR